jgi:antitoxin VapB
MTTRTAKLFKNGSSQAVRPPAGFRFSGDAVRIRRNEETGEVVLAPLSEPWDRYFALRAGTPQRAGFLSRRGDTPPQKRKGL